MFQSVGEFSDDLDRDTSTSSVFRGEEPANSALNTTTQNVRRLMASAAAEQQSANKFTFDSGWIFPQFLFLMYSETSGISYICNELSTTAKLFEEIDVHVWQWYHRETTMQMTTICLQLSSESRARDSFNWHHDIKRFMQQLKLQHQVLYHCFKSFQLNLPL